MNFLDFNELMSQKGRDWKIDDRMLEMWQNLCTQVHNTECLAYEIIQKYANGKIKIPLVSNIQYYICGDQFLNRLKCQILPIYLKLSLNTFETSDYGDEKIRRTQYP